MGVSASHVSQCTTFSSSSSSVFQVGMLSYFLDQWRSIASNRIVLNMVQGHYLQLRSHFPLFLNFQQFSVKTAASHHPIIQKEVDELLAKGVIEPSSVGAAFNSSVFVVPKHTGGLWPILNPKWFNCFCICLLLRCLLSDMSSNLFSMVIMLSPLISRMLLYIFLLLSFISIFYVLFGTMCHISGKFCPFGLPQPLGFSQPSLNLSCSFAITRVFKLLPIWMISWSWSSLKWAGKRAHLFLCFLVVHLGLYINFSKSDLCPTQTFCF